MVSQCQVRRHGGELAIGWILCNSEEPAAVHGGWLGSSQRMFAASGRQAALHVYTQTDILGAHAPKPLCWLGSSLADLRTFPDRSRHVAGFQLRRVQLGLIPNDWKPVPSVGHGAREIRVHGDIEHRVIYVARLTEAVYVLHAFQKRSRKTSGRDIEICRMRLEALVRGRVRE